MSGYGIPLDVEAQIRFIVANSEKESIFLYPNPGWKIDSHVMIDWLVTHYELNSRAVSKLVEDIAKEKKE